MSGFSHREFLRLAALAGAGTLAAACQPRQLNAAPTETAAPIINLPAQIPPPMPTGTLLMLWL